MECIYGNVFSLAQHITPIICRLDVFCLPLTYAKNEYEPDLAISRQWLELAAELGHPHAQFVLGQAYETGAGFAADPAQARTWYEKAAAQGDVFAIQHLKAAGNAQ